MQMEYKHHFLINRKSQTSGFFTLQYQIPTYNERKFREFKSIKTTYIIGNVILFYRCYGAVLLTPFVTYRAFDNGLLLHKLTKNVIGGVLIAKI